MIHNGEIKFDGDGDPKGEVYRNIMLGIPTFGKVTTEFFASQISMSKPIFTSIGLFFVKKKPVDVARNEIAFVCEHQAKIGFIFFRDDDVEIPREALNKILKRFTAQERYDPMGNASCIVAGTVYSKQIPPLPMIYKEEGTASFEDWEPGELVECDVVGMGCTLIPIGVFKKMLPFVTEWQCVNENCAVKWDITYNKEETEKLKHQCPHCLQPLIPMYFKTVVDKDQKGQEVQYSEDTYFCLMAKEAGIKVLADTGVQTWHIDYETGRKFGYHDLLGPSWCENGAYYYWPDHTHPEVEKRQYKSKEDGPIKLNLGCGAALIDGYINVDLYTEGADIKCDIRNISPIIYDKGQVDEIRASHLLEHLDREQVRIVVRGWVQALKPGGILDIEVPDFTWCIKNFLEMEEKEWPDRYHFEEAKVFGLQNHPGEYHKTGFTVKKFEALARDLGNMIESYTIEAKTPEEAGRNQGVIFFKAVKKKAGNGDGESSTGQ